MNAAPDATPFGGGAEPPGAGAPPLPDDLQCYDMAGKKEMIIFNHFQYQDTSNFSEELEPRYGTSCDVAALTRVFSGLGFSVAAHHDRTHDQIMDIMSEFINRDHSDTACVCVALLTHGGRGGRVAAADRWFQLRDLVQPLQRAPLAGRPKLLLAQACRGRRRDDGLEYDGAAGGKIGTHADTLIFYSTVEDFVSWRSGDGSWMVQTLCRVVERAHARLDLQRLNALATHAVTHDFISSSLLKKNHLKKQTPETCSTLTKLLFFTCPAPPAPPAADAGCQLL